MKPSFIGSALLAVALLLVAPTAASAATAANSGTQRHCIAKAVPLGESASPKIQCYGTFAAAIRAATKGRVSLSDAITSRKITESELGSASDAPDTNYVLSVDYWDAYYQGSTLTWYQTSTCGYFQASPMPPGWGDKVSSVIAYSGCATTLFWDTGFGQPTYLIHVDGRAATLGAFNDKTSSQKWCPVYPCS
jgi:hypothetical protein